VFELRRDGRHYRNGLGESVDLEPDCLYPLLKSSDVARRAPAAPSRWLLVTQSHVGADTATLRRTAPKTWNYLATHAARLDRRGSSIYKGRGPFSIFGVGPYSFTPWKVAVSGLYKSVHFRVVGPHGGRPVVFDDTCYFLPCADRPQAEAVVRVLDFEAARGLLSALIFRDAKRPITAEMLQRLDLTRLATACGVSPDFLPTDGTVKPPEAAGPVQGILFP
jgi:hypothetical protein